jgi:nucleoside-diphosphate-sugar epimerase
VLRDEKILITGPAGQIAFPLCRYLAGANDVWGIARFSQAGSRERVEAAGVTTRVVDLGDPDWSDVPDDFTYVLHLAAYLAPGLDYDAAIRVNAEGVGSLLHHCRRAKAALVMSTGSVYLPHDDPWHPYVETDPLGGAQLPAVPTYSVSKLGEEAVARSAARTLGLPVVIARMNAAYGPNGGLPVYALDAVVGGQTVPARWDPSPYSPIYEEDVNDQAEAILSIASVPATIVNWGGDEPVSIQQWSAYFGDLTGRPAQLTVVESPGTWRGVVLDAVRRRDVTGPCRVGWREGMRRTYEARYPDGVGPDTRARSGAAHAMDESAAG